MERRIAALEAGVAKGDPVAARLERGDAVSEREWLTLCERIRAPLRLGVWQPAHSTWRAGR
jgi:hypothetical protein